MCVRFEWEKKRIYRSELLGREVREKEKPWERREREREK